MLVLFNWFKTLFLSIAHFAKSSQYSQLQTVSNVGLGQSTYKHDYLVESQDIGLSIAYYPKLISYLEMDHQHLINLYTDINAALELKEYSVVGDCLAQFKEDFKSHLEDENIKFYGFLEQSLKHKNEEFVSLRRFRKEMRTIERNVIKFLDYWMDIGVTAESYQEFKTQYDAIGHALVKRIESEENGMYKMYSHA